MITHSSTDLYGLEKLYSTLHIENYHFLCMSLNVHTGKQFCCIEVHFSKVATILSTSAFESLPNLLMPMNTRPNLDGKNIKINKT
jgi:hypothetical protein